MAYKLSLSCGGFKGGAGAVKGLFFAAEHLLTFDCSHFIGYAQYLGAALEKHGCLLFAQGRLHLHSPASGGLPGLGLSLSGSW